jgi:hypothetical protein
VACVGRCSVCVAVRGGGGRSLGGLIDRRERMVFYVVGERKGVREREWKGQQEYGIGKFYTTCIVEII